MSTNVLAIKNLHAIVAGSNAQENNSQQDVKEILHGIDLNIGQGEVHVILGPNGSGKSTLMNVIMGHPSVPIGASGYSFLLIPPEPNFIFIPGKSFKSPPPCLSPSPHH